MRLRIVSDGTGATTHIFPEDEGDGRGHLRDVQSLSWRVTTKGVAELTMVVSRVPIEVVADAELREAE